jgi:hypothetical protein
MGVGDGEFNGDRHCLISFCVMLDSSSCSSCFVFSSFRIEEFASEERMCVTSDKGVSEGEMRIRT